MPLSSFQRQVLLLLKGSRNPESYVAGDTVIQRDAASLRYSSDIDFFHDTDLAVTTAFQSDRATLLEHDYAFEILISQPSFFARKCLAWVAAPKPRQVQRRGRVLLADDRRQRTSTPGLHGATDAARAQRSHV